MENWLILVWTSILSFVIIGWVLSLYGRGKKLPPGPFIIPIIGGIIWIRRNFSELEPILRRLHSKHGPLVTLHITSRPSVFVADRSLARHALVHNGAAFASRPSPLPTALFIGITNISSSAYGPKWRALRRNLTSEVLRSSSSFSSARRWVLGLLLDRLRREPTAPAVEHLRHAMFCLLALMCFGDKLDENTIVEIEKVQRRILLGFSRFAILNFCPPLTKIVLRRRWQELAKIRHDQTELFLPLINARSKTAAVTASADPVRCYVDTLLDLRIPVDDGDDPTVTASADPARKLELYEVVSLCSEFFNGGTDTTSTSLQWILANLVKHPEIQERLYAEISEHSNEAADVISEEEAGKMKYLTAVILEGLRRHPPGHFLLPHSVTEDVELGGYRIPKKGSINFMVAEMGWDPAVWEDPMEFRPERFLAGDDGENLNVVLAKGGDIKMMPFGAGRRICPASDLALLHLKYFVANLVWEFKWSPDPDHPVDLAEKQEFTTVMKYPLHARLSQRRSSQL